MTGTGGERSREPVPPQVGRVGDDGVTVTYRTPENAFAFWSMVGFGVAVSIVAAIGLIAVTWPLVALAPLPAVGVWYLAVRLFRRSGLVVDSYRLVVVDPFRSRTIEWSDVEGFSCDVNGRWLEVDLADDDSVTVWGVQGRNLYRPTYAEQTARELRERLEVLPAG